jgi:signal transduction histidine kinase
MEAKNFNNDFSLFGTGVLTRNLLPNIISYSLLGTKQKKGYLLVGRCWLPTRPAVPENKKDPVLWDDSVEKTEIWHGAENIAKMSWDILSRAKETSNFCHDSNSPSVFVSNEQYLRWLMQLSQRGVRHRFLTEITNENINYCKELAKYVELRHLDGVKGNFSIVDRKNYAAIANLSSFQPPSDLIVSNARQFVEQQQYFFDMLWNRAIAAEQRIRELEEGIRPDFIETITDPYTVQKLGFELASSARHEILAIFSTCNAFHRQERAGAIKLLKDRAERHNLKVRILTPEDERIKAFVANLRKQQQEEEQDKNSNIDIRFIEPSQQTKVSILIADKKYSLAVELKDDTKETSIEAMGMATYSNSKATVLSYASIFESLWTHVELYEQLKVHEKMEKEFINIAAHELRTPMQPIIGLSELLRSNIASKKQREIIDVIIKNANRLQLLTEDLLDVATIESQSLKLRKERVDLNELVQNSLQDMARQIDNGKNMKLRLVCDLAPGSIFVQADKERLTQVISNLLNNAIKFTGKGGTVDVRTRKSIGMTEGHHREALISIKDTGIGIDPEVMSRLFTKFASKSEKGTGLGLFISKSIVEAHGGKIWADNNIDSNKGATFTFTIPIDDH